MEIKNKKKLIQVQVATCAMKMHRTRLFTHTREFPRRSIERKNLELESLRFIAKSMLTVNFIKSPSSVKTKVADLRIK